MARGHTDRAKPELWHVLSRSDPPLGAGIQKIASASARALRIPALVGAANPARPPHVSSLTPGGPGLHRPVGAEPAVPKERGRILQRGGGVPEKASAPPVGHKYTIPTSSLLLAGPLPGVEHPWTAGAAARHGPTA